MGADRVSGAFFLSQREGVGCWVALRGEVWHTSLGEGRGHGGWGADRVSGAFSLSHREGVSGWVALRGEVWHTSFGEGRGRRDWGADRVSGLSPCLTGREWAAGWP